MKKFLLIMIVLIACICCLSSCGVLEKFFPCKHNNTITDAAVTATCTKSGLTEGSHCAKCGETVVTQKTIAALGHTEVTDAAIEPTCTDTGFTEGKHCTVCNEVIVPQVVVKALGHRELTDEAVKPDCTNSGFTEGKHCTVCNAVTVPQQVISALGHKEVIDNAIAATCTEDGLTAGAHCTVCNEVVIEQEVIPAAHSWGEWIATAEGDCFFAGAETRVCSACGEEENETLSQLEHNFVFNGATGINGCEHCGAGLYDGHIYVIFTETSSWFDAYANCDKLGGHLITITDENEQTYIESYMNSKSFTSQAWIGCYFDGVKWQWITDEEFDYTNWSSGEPNCSSGTEFFGELNNHTLGMWNDLAPTSQQYFICEWKATE